MLRTGDVPALRTLSLHISPLVSMPSSWSGFLHSLSNITHIKQGGPFPWFQFENPRGVCDGLSLGHVPIPGPIPVASGD